MSDSTEHLDAIRRQFTRQADAYIRLRQTTDERGLNGLVRISGAEPSHRVLDVACGPGFLTMAFARRVASAVGVDATDTFLERARAEAARLELRNIEFRTGDAERLPFADAEFDVASCRAAFRHFLRPDRVLAEMARVVRPGGRVMVADMLTSEDPAKAEYHNRLERLCDPTHVRALPPSEFRRIIEDAGLEVVAAPQAEMDFDLEEWLSYGGPTDEAQREIMTLMTAALEEDRTDLRVRREEGRVRFSYTNGAFVLARPA